MNNFKNEDLLINKNILKIMNKIGIASKNANAECYAVGGIVRDAILHKRNDDLDVVCTDINKVYNELKKINKKIKDLSSEKGISKEKFLTKIISMSNKKIDLVEPRKEIYTKDSIKPIVTKGTIEDDINRRDFTINSMMIKILPMKEKYTLENIIDLTKHGIDDLKRRLLRTVNIENPIKVFDEDPSRVLRGIRFASCYNLDIEEKTKNAMIKASKYYDLQSEKKKKVPRDLIHKEIEKGAQCQNYFENMLSIKTFEKLFPEVMRLKNLKQNPKYHTEDAFNHTFLYVKNLKYPRKNKIIKENGVSKSLLKLIGILHDIGKYETTDKKTYSAIDHAKVSAKESEDILKRLGYPKRNVNIATDLIKKHMNFLTLVNNVCNDKNNYCKIPEEINMKPIRKFYNKHKEWEILILKNMAKADILSDHPHKYAELSKLNQVWKLMKNYGKESKNKNKKPDYNGNDIKEIFKIEPGPTIGTIMNEINDRIFSGEIENSHDEIIKYIKSHKNDLLKICNLKNEKK